MPISTIFTALFYPYIAQERTAQSEILSVRSECFALSLKERHRSQIQGSLKSEERKSDFKERCAQLCRHHTDRNADGKFRHICRMSQDQAIRVTEEFSDIYDGNFHHKYRSFRTISEFSDKILLLVPEFSDNIGVFRQNYIPNNGIFRRYRNFPME